MRTWASSRSDSSYQSDILLQLTTTFALFGLLWAIFATPKEIEHYSQERDDETVSRRSLLGSAGWGVGTAAAAFVVGVSAWLMVTPRKMRVSAASKGNNVNSIVATQRAEQGNPLPTALPTETPETVSAVEPVEVANSSRTSFFRMKLTRWRSSSNSMPKKNLSGFDRNRRLLPRLQKLDRSHGQRGGMEAQDIRHGRYTA